MGVPLAALRAYEARQARVERVLARVDRVAGSKAVARSLRLLPLTMAACHCRRKFDALLVTSTTEGGL